MDQSYELQIGAGAGEELEDLLKAIRADRAADRAFAAALREAMIESLNDFRTQSE